MRSIEARLSRLEEAQNPSNAAMRVILRSITGEEPSRADCVTLEELVSGANELDDGNPE